MAEAKDQWATRGYTHMVSLDYVLLLVFELVGVGGFLLEALPLGGERVGGRGKGGREEGGE